MSTAPITALCVTYDSQDTIAETLEALRPSHEQGLLDCIVIDNDSGDRTREIVSGHKWVRLIESPENEGYGRACNRGFEYAESPFVLVLNADAHIAPPALEQLLAFIRERDEVAVVAPAYDAAPGHLHLGGGLPTPGGIARAVAPGPLHRRDLVELVPGTPPRRLDWLPGSILLVRSSAFRQLGGFDPRFFLYFEETDLLKRLADAGHEAWAVCDAVATHMPGSSAAGTGLTLFRGAIAKHYFESRFYYLVKHHGRAAAVGAELAEAGLLLARYLARCLVLRPDRQLLARFRGPLCRQPERVP